VYAPAAGVPLERIEYYRGGEVGDEIFAVAVEHALDQQAVDGAAVQAVLLAAQGEELQAQRYGQADYACHVISWNLAQDTGIHSIHGGLECG